MKIIDGVSKINCYLTGLLSYARIMKFEVQKEPLTTTFMNLFTSKEKEVLSLISIGLTTKEIAARLNISHHTVETHRKNLLRKGDARNSAQLVQMALSQQIIVS